VYFVTKVVGVFVRFRAPSARHLPGRTPTARGRGCRRGADFEPTSFTAALLGADWGGRPALLERTLGARCFGVLRGLVADFVVIVVCPSRDKKDRGGRRSRNVDKPIICCVPSNSDRHLGLLLLFTARTLCRVLDTSTSYTTADLRRRVLPSRRRTWSPMFRLPRRRVRYGCTVQHTTCAAPTSFRCHRARLRGPR
jgi:hypothetical protein